MNRQGRNCAGLPKLKSVAHLVLRLLLSISATEPIHAADASSVWAHDNVVHVEGGTVAGAPSATPAGVRVFKGIPYAAPPTGGLRWQPPQPVIPWNGVRRADTFAPSCTQPRLDPSDLIYDLVPSETQAISEDCLYLNIWTAAHSQSERRPVLLWIHPSAGTIGGAVAPPYDGEALAKKGIVVVTINYRLGVLGFLAHPELSRESPHHVSGNYGLLDMIAAVKWVRRNISRFGGDPDRITLCGESHGGAAVSALTASPLIRGDIHGAIVMDSVQTSYSKLTDEERNGAEFAKAAGAASIKDLRHMPPERLMAALSAFQTQNHSISLDHILDNWVFSADLFSTEKQGIQRNIPILTGSVADVGATFSPVPAATFIEESHAAYGTLVNHYLGLYPGGSDEEAAVSQVRSWTDRLAWMHDKWAALHTAGGGRAYLYFFTHAPPRPPNARQAAFGGPLREHLGAYHTGEVPYVFNSLGKLDFPWTASDYRLADIMTSYWANFAAKGDPNGPGLPRWPAYGDLDKPVMELGDQVRSIPRVLNEAKEAFWTDYLLKSKTK
jgi:para-nitrobenzyl esterase